MRVKSGILKQMHLKEDCCLLTAKDVVILLDFFKMLDIHNTMGLDDIQFCAMLSTLTDLSQTEARRVFDMLDVDGSGEIDFDEFYILSAILIAVKDGRAKQFIARHSRTVFDLLDFDASDSISAKEFTSLELLFNFKGDAVRRIFHEFDVSGDQRLDYKEFRMFAMACVDQEAEVQNKLEKKRQARAERKLCAWSGCVLL